MKISVIIITKNEEKMLPFCIKSIRQLADEIIVVDSGSTDSTLSIAQKAKAKIIKIPYTSDYSTSRNTGFKNALGDWILYIDADERLTQAQRQEILSVTKHIPADTICSYKFPRKNIILGKWLRHGGFWPDYVHRLFHKKALIKWTGKLHESPTTKGEVKFLKNPLKHYTARSINSALQKSAQWSSLEAKLLFKARAPKVNSLKVVKAYFAILFKLLFIKKGFLDGIRGIILGHIQAYHQASVLVHLWQLQQ